MHLHIAKNAAELGRDAAAYVADALKTVIAQNGYARIVLSTGASQFETLQALVECPDIDWTKVEMFHLDEYVGLPETHIASFRKYLKERFISKVNLMGYTLVDGDPSHIPALTEKLRERPVDIGLIGIGENAHIAFNDPPADFNTQEAYIVVNLNDTCKKQQCREGWFATPDDVPKQAISMTVYQIMQCKKIVTCAPHGVKANAIRDALYANLSCMVPAAMLRFHPDWTLFVDEDSGKYIQKERP